MASGSIWTQASKKLRMFAPVYAFIPSKAFGYPGDLPSLFETLRVMMDDLTLTLRDAFARIGWTLGDWKGEFGLTRDGRLLLADVVDNDSWRVRDSLGVERSKQVIRDGKSVEEACEDFRVVAFVSKLLPDSHPQL